MMKINSFVAVLLLPLSPTIEMGLGEIPEFQYAYE